MKRIVFATANKGKLREAAEILGPGFEVLSPADLGIDGDVEENGASLKENSLIKARHVYGLTGLDCFADDTGLEVDALGGAPGIYSARYAGEGHDSGANMAKLLSELEKLGPDAGRSARFRTVVTLILGGKEYFFDGTVEGSIARERSGSGGFGYDPIFVPDAAELEAAGINMAGNASCSAGWTAPGPSACGHGDMAVCSGAGPLTLAALSDEQKNAVSHRGKAIRAMAAFLAR